jgi:hypothetical protein
MEHKGLEYTVVQGFERGVWKWSASVAGVVVTGQEPSRSAGGGRSGERYRPALVQKKVRLVGPLQPD